MAAGEVLEELQKLGCNITEEEIHLEEEIGKGMFSSVYKGQYDNKAVAVKKIDLPDTEDEVLKFIKREVVVMKSLSHPCIVQFYGIVRVGKHGLWLVTEYVPNKALSKWLTTQNLEISWRLRTRFAHDIATAMTYLHGQNVMHRDMKSENILVDSLWRLKVADFGFARTAANDHIDRPMTMCGTDEYMAPELMLGMPYDFSVDVFSFAIILSEIITRLPASSHQLKRSPVDAFQINEAGIRKAAPADTPEALLSLTMRCGIYEGHKRPSFAEIARELAQLEKTLPSPEGWDNLTGVAPPKLFTKHRRVAARLSVTLSEGQSIGDLAGTELTRRTLAAAGVSPKGSPTSSSTAGTPRKARALPTPPKQARTLPSNMSRNAILGPSPLAEEDDELTEEDLAAMSAILEREKQ